MIAFILGLAFIERPSSMSVTSDLRYKQCPWEAPCGLTETIEMLCLLTFTLDLAAKVHLDIVHPGLLLELQIVLYECMNEFV